MIMSTFHLYISERSVWDHLPSMDMVLGFHEGVAPSSRVGESTGSLEGPIHSFCQLTGGAWLGEGRKHGDWIDISHSKVIRAHLQQPSENLQYVSSCSMSQPHQIKFFSKLLELGMTKLNNVHWNPIWQFSELWRHRHTWFGRYKCIAPPPLPPICRVLLLHITYLQKEKKRLTIFLPSSRNNDSKEQHVAWWEQCADT
jgi:hypothetical protein